MPEGKNKWWLNGGRGSGRTFRLLWETYENKIAELKRENAVLKAQHKANLRQIQAILNQRSLQNAKLTKAKEIIALGLRVCETSSIEYMNLYQKQAEQFLKADVGTKNYEEQDKILKTRLL